MESPRAEKGSSAAVMQERKQPRIDKEAGAANHRNPQEAGRLRPASRTAGTVLLGSERRNAEKKDAFLLHPRAAEAFQDKPAAAEQEGDDEHPGRDHGG